MAVLAHRRDRYLREPRLAPRSDGATLTVVAWEGETERLMTVDVDAEGEPVGEPAAGPPRERIVAVTAGGAPEPTDDPGVEDRDGDGGWRVEVQREGEGVSVVVATMPDGREVTVFRARATAAAPAVRVAGQGAFIAFHHNLREDQPATDIAKWIAIRHVDEHGQVREPAVPMTGRDRDREGVEQSFEFPTLLVGDDGALLILGRGSHSFHAQELSAAGFGPRVALSDGQWGCRGRRVAALRVPGGVLTARREKEGIVLTRLPLPAGGPPPLRPAEVEPDVGPPPLIRIDPACDPARADGRLTLFGDIHQHSAHSDGIGTADEAYLRARYEHGDDFCALTDHESFIGKRIGPGEWARLCAVADRHDDPGHFATLIAYEWTGRMYPGPGHKVVYLPGPGIPILSRDDVPEGTDLVKRVDAQGGFSVPHHTGWTGADEPAHDPALQPVWEICSCHGCYETACHPLGARGERRDQVAEVMLRRGHRFGFIASSDSHGLVRHHGMARKRDPFRTGLTAVQATACSRAAILGAIRERRCYATSGAKILLDVRVGDQPMGSILRAPGAVPVEVLVVGTAAVARLELIGESGVLAAWAPEAREVRVTASASSSFLYARVTQQDGEMAWSSPVFVDRAAA